MKNIHPIPPLSIVKLVRADGHTPIWKNQIGRIFRIGYYNRQDGTDCVWLVNAAGEYEQTANQNAIKDYFEVVERSRERAFFGRNRPRIRPLTNGRTKARIIPSVNGFHRAKAPATSTTH